MQDRTEISKQVTIIKPQRGLVNLNLGELFAYKELLYFFVWRDIKVKYKQTLLGVLWAILVPVAQMLIFTFLFANLAQLPTNGINPSLWYLSGLTLWAYFANVMNQSSNSLISNANFLTKIYFPRVLIPLSPAFSSLLDFSVAFIALLALVLILGLGISINVIFIFISLAIALITALGVGYFFAAANVKYRDVRYLLPIVTQLWMFLSVIYPYNKIPDELFWKKIYALNPMVAAVESFRWSLFPQSGDFPLDLLLMAFPISLAIFAGGLIYFKKMEKSFADII
jgi:homopolymeric O-antigen transport system permease protein